MTMILITNENRVKLWSPIIPFPFIYTRECVRKDGYADTVRTFWTLKRLLLDWVNIIIEGDPELVAIDVDSRIFKILYHRIARHIDASVSFVYLSADYLDLARHSEMDVGEFEMTRFHIPRVIVAHYRDGLRSRRERIEAITEWHGWHGAPTKSESWMREKSRQVKLIQSALTRMWHVYRKSLYKHIVLDAFQKELLKYECSDERAVRGVLGLEVDKLRPVKKRILFFHWKTGEMETNPAYERLCIIKQSAQARLEDIIQCQTSQTEAVPESNKMERKAIEEERKRKRKERKERERKEREARLDQLTIRGYHCTNADAARTIVETQTFLRGSVGMAGGGIYFAISPDDALRKANNKMGNPVMLVATVRLGHQYAMPKEGDKTMTFTKLRHMQKDSVLLLRDYGYEYVVYSSDQVVNVKYYV